MLFTFRSLLPGPEIDGSCQIDVSILKSIQNSANIVRREVVYLRNVASKQEMLKRKGWCNEDDRADKTARSAGE
jgi:hypothetical protein